MEKNQVKLGMIVRVNGGPCGRVVEIDNERSSYPYKVRYSGGFVLSINSILIAEGDLAA